VEENAKQVGDRNAQRHFRGVAGSPNASDVYENRVTTWSLGRNLELIFQGVSN
jgi:hypothetical protein